MKGLTNMVICPHCHSADHAVIGHDDTASVVTYRKDGKETTRLVVMRLCMNCGTVYVAVKDCEEVKQGLEMDNRNE